LIFESTASVRVGKFAELMARATEACQDLATGSIENFHLFVAAIGHEHVPLFTARRKSDPPDGSPFIGKNVPSFDPDIPLEVPGLSNT
jgi:hypothetical protein